MSSVSVVIPATDNYCKVGTCQFCKKSTGGSKSCNSCKNSVKSLVEVGTADVFKCEKGSIANCSEYFGPESNQNTGCAGCEDGYKTKESGQVNGKNNFILRRLKEQGLLSYKTARLIIINGIVKHLSVKFIAQSVIKDLLTFMAVTIL
jgi:hypothetical protein